MTNNFSLAFFSPICLRPWMTMQGWQWACTIIIMAACYNDSNIKILFTHGTGRIRNHVVISKVPSVYMYISFVLHSSEYAYKRCLRSRTISKCKHQNSHYLVCCLLLLTLHEREMEITSSRWVAPSRFRAQWAKCVPGWWSKKSWELLFVTIWAFSSS